MKQNKRVKYLGGNVFNDKGEQILTQRDAWAEEAKCGCGIDCCEGAVVFTDITTFDFTNLYFDNGSLKFKIGDVVYVVTAVAE